MDLLDGGEVVGKGRVISTYPASTVHGQPMPAGHVSVTAVWVLKGATWIPYPPPHEPELCTLGHVMGYIIPWPRVALAVCMFRFRSSICIHICIFFLMKQGSYSILFDTTVCTFSMFAGRREDGFTIAFSKLLSRFTRKQVLFHERRGF